MNVGYDICRIKTEVSENGVTVKAGHDYQKRDRLTRAKRWELQEAEETYQKTQLDRSVVVPDQIRTIIRTFREKLFTEIFTDRPARAKAMGLDEPWVPKTLIFAKDDNHAEDTVDIVRKEVGNGAFATDDQDAYLDAWQSVDSDEGVPLAVANRVFGGDPKPFIEELNQALIA